MARLLATGPALSRGQRRRATGRILFGAVGDESRLEYTVIGEAVNLGAKLEKHNKDPGRARHLRRQETKALSRASFEPAVRASDRRQVAGEGNPADEVELLDRCDRLERRARRRGQALARRPAA